MTRWIIAGVCLIVLLFIGALIFFGVHTQVEERYYEVTRSSLGRSARGLGKVEPRTPPAALSFTISGRLKAVLVEEGQKNIPKGQVLAELDASDLDARLAAAQAALKEAAAREKLVVEPPREIEWQSLAEKVHAAEKEVEAAKARVRNLEQPVAPPPAPKGQVDAAQKEAERALYLCNEAVYAQQRVFAGSTEDDLAIAEAKWQVARIDVTDAEEKLKILEADGWPGSYTGTMKRWERAGVAQNVERTKRREHLAQAEYEKVKRGATQDEKNGAVARAKAASAVYEAAAANLERLKNPPVPPRGADFDIELAKNAQAQAEAGLRAAQAALTLAQAGPRDAEKAVARAAVEHAEKAVDEVKALRQQATLVAPFNGVVVERLQEPGSVVSPNLPVLTLANLDSLRVRAELDAVWSAEARPGQGVTLLGNLLPGGPLTGKIARVLDLAGPRSLFSQDPRETKGGEVVTVLVDLDPPQSEGGKASLAALRPGVRLEVKVDFETRENVLSVPRAFVMYDNGKYVVLKGESRSGTRVGAVHRAEVELGWRDELSCEVVSGLAEGDVLVKPPGAP